MLERQEKSQDHTRWIIERTVSFEGDVSRVRFLLETSTFCLNIVRAPSGRGPPYRDDSTSPKLKSQKPSPRRKSHSGLGLSSRSRGSIVVSMRKSLIFLARPPSRVLTHTPPTTHHGCSSHILMSDCPAIEEGPGRPRGMHCRGISNVSS